MSARYCIIAAGGTGGHMFPAQAVAEALLAEGWRVDLFTDDRGARFAGGFPDAVGRCVLPAATTARGGILAKFIVPFTLLRGVIVALRSMRRARPDCVVGFGGYPTIPALGAAVCLRIPRMIHEQNGVLGRVNRLFARHVRHVACGTWPTALPKGAQGVHVGNPVRQKVLDLQGAPYIAPGDYPLALVIMGGSQGARILSDVVPGALAALPDVLRKRLRVSHQARPEDLPRIEAAYAQAQIPADVAPFFDDIPRRINEAQLVISRAGASSVADIGVIGRPALLIPFAAAMDDHQSANAAAVVQTGGAIALSEAEFTIHNATTAISDILSNPDRASAMAAAALSGSRPDATQALVKLIQAL